MISERYPGFQLVQRLSSYPLLNDSFTQATSYYSWFKSSSRLVSGTLSLAEKSVKTVASSTQPLLNRFDSKLSCIESAACYGLGNLEERYPGMLKPSQDILDETKEYIGSSLHPYVDRITNPITTTYTTVTLNIKRVRHYGQNTVSSAVNFSMKNLSRLGPASTVGHKSLQMLGEVLDAADKYADRYLPRGDETELSDKELKHCSQLPITQKAGRISGKIRRRMRARAMRELRSVRQRSEDVIQKFHLTVDIMDMARARLDQTKLRLSDLTEEYSEIVQQLEEDDKQKEGVRLNDSYLIKLTANAANQLRRTMFATSFVLYKHLSEENQCRLSKAKQQADMLFSSISKTENLSSLTDLFFQQTRETLKQLRKSVALTFDYLLKNKLFELLRRRSSVSSSQESDNMSFSENGTAGVSSSNGISD